MNTRHLLFRLATAVLCLAAGSALAGEYPAQLQWAQRVVLSLPVSGVIATVAVDVGDRVKRGDPLLALDARGFKAAVQQANAELAGLRAARDEAKREQDRAEELYARTVLSDHDLQVAKDAYINADAGYQAARARQTHAELDLENSRIVAPIDAVVVQRLAEPGQSVAAMLQTTPLLVLAASDRMQAHATLSVDELSRYQRGASANVELAGKTYTGKIHSLGLEPIDAAGEPRYALVVEFPLDDDLTLRAGQSATVKLP